MTLATRAALGAIRVVVTLFAAGLTVSQSMHARAADRVNPADPAKVIRQVFPAA